MDDLISIIIPVYNVEAYLDKLLLSIVKQTYTNLDIILVDDGSTDRSGQLCDKWALKDNRIQVVHNRNKGVAAARNYGMSIAKGEYIGFADPDDWIDETMFECLLSTIKQFKADIVICGFEEVNNSQAKVKQVKFTRYYTRDEALFELIKDKDIQNYVWNKLFSKKCIPVSPFPEIRRISDLAGMYKFFQKAESVVQVNKSFYHYMRRDGSLENGSMETRLCYCVATQMQFEGMQGENETIQQFVTAKYIAVLENTIKGFINDGSVLAKECYPILEKTVTPFYFSHLDDFRKRKDFTEEKEKMLSSFLQNPESFCKKKLAETLKPNKKKKIKPDNSQTDKSKDREIMRLKKEIKRIKHSYSYRIGRAATFLPRKIRDLIIVNKNNNS